MPHMPRVLGRARTAPRGAGRRLLVALPAALLLVSCGAGGPAAPAQDPAAGSQPTATAGGDERSPAGMEAAGPTAQPTDLAAIEELEGEAREAALYECAKGEEPLLWYTTLIEDQLARPLADAFSEAYPGLSVEISRTISSGVTEKMVLEARAGRIESDVWSSSDVVPLMQAELTEPYDFPTASDYPEDLKDPDGAWASSNIYVMSPAYNTNAIPAEAVPETYEDLLDPRFKGRMAWSTSASASGWTGFVGHVLLTMGQDAGMAYLEQLAQQDIAPLDVSGRQVVDQVIAGEYDIGLHMFNNHPVISAQQGAPADWIPMEPLMVSPAPTGLTRGASSPCAARLFMDYQLGAEGQQVFREANYLPAHPDVPASEPTLIPSETGLEHQVMDPVTFDEHREEWNAVIDQLFR